MTFYYYIIFEGEWFISSWVVLYTALLKSSTSKKRLLEVTLIVSFYYGSRKCAGIAVFFVFDVSSYIHCSHTSLSYLCCQFN